MTIRETTAAAYTPDTQARFPERELAKLATEYETTAAVWANNSRAALAKKATARAETLRQAIDSHDALRDRCLTAELERDQLRARLAALEAERVPAGATAGGSQT